MNTSHARRPISRQKLNVSATSNDNSPKLKTPQNNTETYEQPYEYSSKGEFSKGEVEEIEHQKRIAYRNLCASLFSTPSIPPQESLLQDTPVRASPASRMMNRVAQTPELTAQKSVVLGR